MLKNNISGKIQITKNNKPEIKLKSNWEITHSVGKRNTDKINKNKGNKEILIYKTRRGAAPKFTKFTTHTMTRKRRNATKKVIELII